MIATLSKTYRLRSIGGTSAGAIAAAAAAAAQLGVLSGRNPHAFEDLDGLPQYLGGRAEGEKQSRLLRLFQPARSLRRHFHLFVEMLNAPSSALLLLPRYFRFGACIGAIPGLLLLSQTAGLRSIINICIAGIGLFLGATIEALWSFGRFLPESHFGLCNGTALTRWLTEYFNKLSGKTPEEPLTFGELWAEKIELAMMTTAVNPGRPYRLPFEIAEFYFIEEELASFFPQDVKEWMVAHARPSETAEKLRTPSQTFHALPRAADLPVVFAVRLSLSYPILLSAIPLYIVDRTLDCNHREPARATRVYFSDGGICSNFPIHFFNNPPPMCPTFGVNVRGFHPDHPNKRVWMPEPGHPNQGRLIHCPPLSDKPGLRSVMAFLTSIARTMQEWRDEIQITMPGVRNRIVHISHSRKEGGLNLNMSAETIQLLSESGAEAAELLINTFDK